MIPAGEIQNLPVVAAKGDVGGRGSPVHDAPELLAARVHDPYAARAAAIDIAFDIDFIPSGTPASSNGKPLCPARISSAGYCGCR